jgi:hypothetical protein
MTRVPTAPFHRPPIDEALIASFMHRQSDLQKRLMAGAIAGGIALCLFAVLVITLLVFMLIGPVGESFVLTYLVVAVVSLPISFVIAHYLKGSILEATVPDSDLLSNRMMSRTVGVPLVVAEIANFGPRLVLYGVKTLRGRRWIVPPDPGRIATAIAMLVAADSALSPGKLLLPGETADDLEPLLAFLLYHELVDLSKNGDRLWLTTEGKRKLGLTPPVLAS